MQKSDRTLREHFKSACRDRKYVDMVRGDKTTRESKARERFKRPAYDICKKGGT